MIAITKNGNFLFVSENLNNKLFVVGTIIFQHDNGDYHTDDVCRWNNALMFSYSCYE